MVKHKKLIAIITLLVILLNFMPLQVFAEPDPDPEPNPYEGYAKIELRGATGIDEENNCVSYMGGVFIGRVSAQGIIRLVAENIEEPGEPIRTNYYLYTNADSIRLEGYYLDEAYDIHGYSVGLSPEYVDSSNEGYIEISGLNGETDTYIEFDIGERDYSINFRDAIRNTDDTVTFDADGIEVTLTVSGTSRNIEKYTWHDDEEDRDIDNYYINVPISEFEDLLFTLDENYDPEFMTAFVGYTGDQIDENSWEYNEYDLEIEDSAFTLEGQEINDYHCDIGIRVPYVEHNDYEINFDSWRVVANTSTSVTYEVDEDVNVTATLLSGTNEPIVFEEGEDEFQNHWENCCLRIPEEDIETIDDIVFELSENYDPETMQVKVWDGYGEEGNSDNPYHEWLLAVDEETRQFSLSGVTEQFNRGRVVLVIERIGGEYFPQGYEISFDGARVTGSTPTSVTYEVDEETNVTATLISGTEQEIIFEEGEDPEHNHWQNYSLFIPEEEMELIGLITFQLSENYDPETMQVRVWDGDFDENSENPYHEWFLYVNEQNQFTLGGVTNEFNRGRAVLVIERQGGGGNYHEGYEINFDGGRVISSTPTSVTYEVDEETNVTATLLSGTNESIIFEEGEDPEHNHWQNYSLFIPEEDINTINNITFQLSDNYDPEIMRVKAWDGNFDENSENPYHEWILYVNEQNQFTLSGIPMQFNRGRVVLVVERIDGNPPIEMEAPELISGHVSVVMHSDPGASGRLYVYYVDSQGYYLDENGTRIGMQMSIGHTFEFDDQPMNTAIPENAVKVQLKVEENLNSSAYIDLYQEDAGGGFGDVLINVNRDEMRLEAYKEFDYAAGDKIGAAIFWRYEGVDDRFVPPASGNWLVAHFNHNEEGYVNYRDEFGEERQVVYEQDNEGIFLPDNFVLNVPDSVANIHVDVFDEESLLLDVDIAEFLYDPDLNNTGKTWEQMTFDERRTCSYWEIFMDTLESNKGTNHYTQLPLMEYVQDLYGNQYDNFAFVFHISFVNPNINEHEMAHVVTWSNVQGSGWGDDALINGGFGKLVKAIYVDPETNAETVIYEADKEERGEYDNTHYFYDEYQQRYTKYIWGEEIEYDEEYDWPEGRGAMYQFAIMQNDNGGEIEAVEGIKLVFELTPDYGKQLVATPLAGSEGVAGDADSSRQYTFEMPPCAIHINAQFEPIENQALVKTDCITYMTYNLEENALDSGTALLTIDPVNEADLTAAQKAGFATIGNTSYDVKAYLDVDLDKVYFKGTNAQFDYNSGYDETEIWTEPVYDLGNKKATITITLAEGLSPDEVVILHELHDDNGNVTGYETCNITDSLRSGDLWIVTFETSKFSNFAIANVVEQPAVIVSNVNYTTHVQGIGWQNYVSNGAMAGTSGRGLRLEAIKINLDENNTYSGSIQYRTHIQGIGWESSWKSDDELSGTSGRGLRLEAIEIKLTDEMAERYDVYYCVHAQGFGWLNWAKNGESAGTSGYAKRLEGIKILLVEKGGDAPEKLGTNGSAFVKYVPPAKVSYTTHVQGIGWQSYVSNGAMAGTSGRGLRLEAIKIKLENLTGDVQYKTHIQGIGWENSWKSNDEISGTSGRGLRLEAIQIKLSGAAAEQYDIYYRVHAQGFGWLGWAKNGESAGTAGYGKRLEGIEIQLVKKGGEAPGSTANAFKQK